MQLPADAIPYLRGERFCAGYRLQLACSAPPRGRRMSDRISLLCEITNGLSVIHAGCVDHGIEQLERQRQRGQWLHERLCAAALRCAGVDLSAEGIEYLRDHLGLTDVYCADLAGDVPVALTGTRWDCLVLGELLEHIDNPVEFLRRIGRSYFRGLADRLILTVPNALCRKNAERATAGVEQINSDHRYWFTPYTISKVLFRAGFFIEDIELAKYAPPSPGWSLRRWRKRRQERQHPLLRDTIVVTARPVVDGTPPPG